MPKRKPIWGIRIEMVESNAGLIFEGFVDTLNQKNRAFFATTPPFRRLSGVFLRSIRNTSVGKIEVGVDSSQKTLLPRFVPNAAFPDYLRGRWLGTFIQLQIANYMRRKYPGFLVLPQGPTARAVSTEQFVHLFSRVLAERLRKSRGAKSIKTRWLPGSEKTRPIRRPKK